MYKIKTTFKHEFGSKRISKHGEIKFNDEGEAEVSKEIYDDVKNAPHGLEFLSDEAEITDEDFNEVENETVDENEEVETESLFKEEDLKELGIEDLRDVAVSAEVYTKAEAAKIKNSDTIIKKILENI